MLTVCIGKTGPEGSHRRWSHLEMRDWLVRRELRPRSLFVKCNEQDRSLGGLCLSSWPCPDPNTGQARHIEGATNNYI